MPFWTETTAFFIKILLEQPDIFHIFLFIIFLWNFIFTKNFSSFDIKIFQPHKTAAFVRMLPENVVVVVRKWRWLNRWLNVKCGNIYVRGRCWIWIFRCDFDRVFWLRIVHMRSWARVRCKSILDLQTFRLVAAILEPNLRENQIN
jgi:hypothetical protein